MGFKLVSLGGSIFIGLKVLCAKNHNFFTICTFFCMLPHYICVYSPHNESPEHEVDQFYSDLRSVLESVPPHNFLSVMGDFNARLGSDLVNFIFNDNTNRNGEKLFDLMDEYNLFSANNYFMKSKTNCGLLNLPLV